MPAAPHLSRRSLRARHRARIGAGDCLVIRSSRFGQPVGGGKEIAKVVALAARVPVSCSAMAISRLRFSSGSATALRRNRNARLPRAPLLAAISIRSLVCSAAASAARNRHRRRGNGPRPGMPRRATSTPALRDRRPDHPAHFDCRDQSRVAAAMSPSETRPSTPEVIERGIPVGWGLRLRGLRQKRIWHRRREA